MGGFLAGGGVKKGALGLLDRRRGELVGLGDGGAALGAGVQLLGGTGRVGRGFDLVEGVVEVAGGSGVLELLLAGEVVEGFGGRRPLHGLFYLAGKGGRGRRAAGRPAARGGVRAYSDTEGCDYRIC